MSDHAWLSAEELTAAPRRRALDASGQPMAGLALLDLEPLGARVSPDIVAATASAVAQTDVVLIARCAVEQVESLRPLAAACTATLVSPPPTAALPPEFVAVDDLDQTAKVLTAAVAGSPRAALVLIDLLRASAGLDVRSGLYAESAAYSMLLASNEFADWRADHPGRPVADPAAPPVMVARNDDELSVTLTRPERRNAFDRWMRDATCDALDVARLDPSIVTVRLAGAGPSFCSGGDLDEFGAQPDVVLGHLIRLERSVGWRLHQLADRAVAEVHGACIGAGMELPAFASRVLARDDTWFQLPEIGMGLIPGAGGTVSLPRRIGRWRTAWLAISGARLDVDTAQRWGLVDHRVA